MFWNSCGLKGAVEGTAYAEDVVTKGKTDKLLCTNQLLNRLFMVAFALLTLLGNNSGILSGAHLFNKCKKVCSLP